MLVDAFQARTHSVRGALLSYTFAPGPKHAHNACPPSHFLRSFTATASRLTDLVVFHEGGGVGPRCQEADASAPRFENVLYVESPPKLVAALRAIKVNQSGGRRAYNWTPATYRFDVFAWWVAEQHEKYAYVGILDTDTIFQRDIFDILHPYLRSGHQLHVVAENPAEQNGPVHTRARIGTTVARMVGEQCWSLPVKLGVSSAQTLRSFWESFGHTDRLCLGTVFGERGAMLHTLQLLTAVIKVAALGCRDQAVFQVLVWTGQLNLNTTVWDYFSGVVKTVDVGGLRDRYGRFVNERGIPYVIVHQLKPDRHMVSDELYRMLPAWPRAAWQQPLFNHSMQRVRLPDIRLPGLAHPATAEMARRRLPNPADPAVPLPMMDCDLQYAIRARRHGPYVSEGSSWEGMVRAGYFSSKWSPARQIEPWNAAINTTFRGLRRALELLQKTGRRDTHAVDEPEHWATQPIEAFITSTMGLGPSRENEAQQRLTAAGVFAVKDLGWLHSYPGFHNCIVTNTTTINPAVANGPDSATASEGDLAKQTAPARLDAVGPTSHDSAALYPGCPRLFCWAVVLPTDPTIQLVEQQLRLCEGSQLFSYAHVRNVNISIAFDESAVTHSKDQNAVPVVSAWSLLASCTDTQLGVKCLWPQVLSADYIVKIDPDTLLWPHLLRSMLPLPRGDRVRAYGAAYICLPGQPGCAIAGPIQILPRRGLEMMQERRSEWPPATNALGKQQHDDVWLVLLLNVLNIPYKELKAGLSPPSDGECRCHGWNPRGLLHKPQPNPAAMSSRGAASCRILSAISLQNGTASWQAEPSSGFNGRKFMGRRGWVDSEAKHYGMGIVTFAHKGRTACMSPLAPIFHALKTAADFVKLRDASASWHASYKATSSAQYGCLLSGR